MEWVVLIYHVSDMTCFERGICWLEVVSNPVPNAQEFEKAAKSNLTLHLEQFQVFLTILFSP